MTDSRRRQSLTGSEPFRHAEPLAFGTSLYAPDCVSASFFRFPLMADADTCAPRTPVLTDLEPPSSSGVLPGDPRTTAEQQIHFYESGAWEQFILEWATGLSGGYVQIKRLGGAGDRGVDIAAFKTAGGFSGSWDCFQGKHYAGALTWTDARPEMLKIFRGVAAGAYVLPDQYAFLAPRGCGPTLNRLLSDPPGLRSKFLAALSETGWLPADLKEPELSAVRAVAEGADFALFRSVELHEALAVHRRTPYHSARFGTALPRRPAIPVPPPEVSTSEARYVDQLLSVYREARGDDLNLEMVKTDADFGPHFRRQRQSFYAAEALRLYARDSVPAGTFEDLQEDIHAGVIEVAELASPDGMERLARVLTAATTVDLQRHSLVSITRTEDRKGVCHQLANEERLRWVR